MRRNNIPIILATVIIALCSVCAVYADDPPLWLQEAARSQTPSFDIKDVPAVVLRNEQSVSVDSTGMVIRTTRYAVRILVREGRNEALARVVYQTDGEKVRDLNAWLIRSSGQPKIYGKKEAVDITIAENDLYNEARVRLIMHRTLRTRATCLDLRPYKKKGPFLVNFSSSSRTTSRSFIRNSI